MERDTDEGEPENSHLTERPLGAYIGSDEEIRYTLRNNRVGLERDDGETTQIRPANGCGAVAGVTDRRVLFVVGDPEGYDGDFAVSLPHTELTTVTVVTEMLTTGLRFVTDNGTEWSFTARESDIDDVASFLKQACETDSTEPPVREQLQSHCQTLADHLESASWTAFDDTRQTALETLDRAREDGTDRNRTERLATELFELVRDRYIAQGQEQLATAESLLESGSFTESYERIEDAREQFELAATVANRHGVDDSPANDCLERVARLTTRATDRPLAVAREIHETATDISELPHRIDGLEETLEAYHEVARLVTAQDTPFEADADVARDEARAVIESLIDARVEYAGECQSAGHWEWDAENDEAAYDLYVTARENLDRAIELASKYPPGDPATLRQQRTELVESFDPLALRYELSEQNAT